MNAFFISGFHVHTLSSVDLENHFKENMPLQFSECLYLIYLHRIPLCLFGYSNPDICSPNLG
jgi:hypothetical protein